MKQKLNKIFKHILYEIAWSGVYYFMNEKSLTDI